MIYALIPAGGKSTRMGRAKLALPLGDRSVLERVIDTVRRAGIADVVVVVGPHVAELVTLAASAGAHVVPLTQETADMRATVEHGLRWLEDHFHPGAEDDWLLLPADHPTLDESVIRQLVAARQEHPKRSIVIPTYRGKRGHPALIAWQHVAGMRGLPADQGLNTYLRQHAAETLEMPVDSPEVLCDLDTPADYERLQRRWSEQI